MIYTARLFLVMYDGQFCQENYLWLTIHKQTLINLAISVISGSVGLSKLLKVGPCRLVPYDEMSFGFLVLVIINASCIIAKGLILSLVLVSVSDGQVDGLNYEFYDLIILWIVICILPHVFLVSTWFL